MSESQSWGSRIGLILAMSGNAVGLGFFLRFPVPVIQNGGGAFIIPYIVCFLLMGIPLLWVEWSMGRFGGKQGNHSTPFIFNSLDKTLIWNYVGVFGIFTNLAVAAYYCYLESWTLSWVWHSVSRYFEGNSPEQVAATTDLATISDLEAKMQMLNLSRLLLLSLYIGICLLVYKAYQRRLKKSKK